MNKLAIILIISVLAVFCFLVPKASTQTVQSPSQTPQPPPSPSITQSDVIRVSTELVQTDVTVLDNKGRFVAGLDRDKFELRVDGKPQSIAFFERVTAGSSKEASLRTSGSSGPRPSSEEGQPTSPSVTDRGRTAFFFVDDLHLSLSSMNRTRELLLNYVDDVMGLKDQAVIATTSGQLGFLQQLTGHRGVLRLASSASPTARPASPTQSLRRR